MNEYLVTWTINITASTPLGAAREARFIQTDPDSTAVVFGVTENANASNETTHHIDLEDYDYDPLDD